MKNQAAQIKILRILVGILFVLVLTTLAICVYLLQSNRRFKEISAERINIVEPGGQLKMVISNEKSQHPGMFNNKLLGARQRPAGIIFFNDEGDECGGLIYDGDKKSASMTYSIDQYKNDQVMQWQYEQSNEKGNFTRSYGLKLWDRSDAFTLPQLIDYTDSLKKLKDVRAYDAGIEKLKATGLLSRERLFVGKNKEGEVGLFLDDANGIPRMKIYINKNNQPVIEMMDDKGNLVTK